MPDYKLIGKNYTTADLYAKVSGYLYVQPVDIGDRVTKGQVLGMCGNSGMFRIRSTRYSTRAKALITKKTNCARWRGIAASGANAIAKIGA